MSQNRAAEKAALFKISLYGLAVAIFFFLVFTMKQEGGRTQGVRDAYVEAVKLLSLNADKENAEYRATLRSYASCLAIQDHAWERMVRDNEKLDYTSSYTYAKTLLPADMKECQAEVDKEVTYYSRPGTDLTPVIKQVNADIAKANSYLYSPPAPKAFFSK